jgi:hypothetical protein
VKIDEMAYRSTQVIALEASIQHLIDVAAGNIHSKSINDGGRNEYMQRQGENILKTVKELMV